jgi:subfamily B ATP-binding cassette protein MsbA
MSVNSRPYYRRLLSYVGNYKLIALFSIIGMLGYSAMDAIFVQLMQPFIDEGLGGKTNEIKRETLLIAPFVVMVLVFFCGLFHCKLLFKLSWLSSC